MTDEHDELIDRLRDADTRAEFRMILYEWNMEREREVIAEAMSQSLPDGVELTFDPGANQT